MTTCGVLARATVVAELDHDRVDAETVAGLIPTTGLPVADAVRQLHDRWGMERRRPPFLGVTPEELRAAGRMLPVASSHPIGQDIDQ